MLKIMCCLTLFDVCKWWWYSWNSQIPNISMNHLLNSGYRINFHSHNVFLISYTCSASCWLKTEILTRPQVKVLYSSLTIVCDRWCEVNTCSSPTRTPPPQHTYRVIIPSPAVLTARGHPDSQRSPWSHSLSRYCTDVINLTWPV